MTPASRRHTRANWVALRTLRQKPKVVGEAPSGELIFEVDSVRLLLPENATHFQRLVACSACGENLAGPPVLNAGELAQQASAVVCKDCVRAAALPIARPDRVPTAPPRPAAPAPPDSRLTAVDRRIAELARQLEAQRLDARKALEAGAAKTQAELTSFAAGTRQLAQRQEALGGAIERLERVAESKAEPADDLDARIEAAVGRETARIAASSQAAVETLQPAMEEQTSLIRAELARVVSRHDAMEGAQRELSLRTDQAVERLTDGVAPQAGRIEALEERLGQLQGTVEADGVVARSGLETGQLAGTELLRISQQLNERLDRLVERATRAAEADARRADEVDLRVAQAVEAPMGRLEALQAEVVSLASRLEQLPATLAAETERVVAPVAEEASTSSRRLEVLETRLLDLQQAVDAAAAARIEELVTRADVDENLRRLDEEQRNRVRAIEVRLAEAEDGANPRLDALQAEVRDLESALERARVDHDDVRRSHDELQAGLHGLVGQLEDVRGAVEAERVRAETDLATRAEVDGKIRSVEEQVRAALAAQAERRGEALARVGVESEHVRRSLDEMGHRLGGVVDRTEALQQTVEAQLATAARRSDRDDLRLQALVRHVEEGVEDRIARVEGEQAAIEEQLHGEVRTRHDELHESVQRLRASLDAEAARARVEPALVEELAEELGRIRTHMAPRLDDLAERTDRLIAAHTQDVDSIARLSHESAQLPAALEALRREVQADLSAAVAEARAAISSATSDDSKRVDSLEEAVTRRDREVSDLFEFHDALDTGLGQLRSELAGLRSAVRVVADTQEGVQERLEALAGGQQRAVSSVERGRKLGRRPAEPVADPAAAQALVHDVQRLLTQVEELERTMSGVIASAARATSQAASASQLRTDLASLRERMAAQDEALATLRARMRSGPGTGASLAVAQKAAPGAKPKSVPRGTKEPSPRAGGRLGGR